MGLAAFLPFATWPCFECLGAGGQIPVSFASLVDGYDQRLVLVILLTLAAAVVGHLATRSRLLAVLCLCAALSAFALGVFDATQPGRLFRWAVLPPDLAYASWWVHPPPTGLGIGFYMFIFGASAAVIGASAGIMPRQRNERWRPLPGPAPPRGESAGPISARNPS